MSNLDLIVGIPSLMLLTTIVASRRQYSETKEWLDSHGSDISFHKAKMKNDKEDSRFKFFNYYVGCFGRKLAYITYRPKRRE